MSKTVPSRSTTGRTSIHWSQAKTVTSGKATVFDSLSTELKVYTELIKFLPNHIFQDTVTIPSPAPITLPVEGFVSGIKQTYIENTPGGGSEKPCKIYCSKPYRDKYTIDFWIFKFQKYQKRLPANDIEVLADRLFG